MSLSRAQSPSETRIGLLGCGAIGRRVAEQLRAGDVRGCGLSAVLTRSSSAPERVDDIDELIGRSDLVVEAAGHGPLAAYGPRITSSGVDLLVVSAGALVDDDLLRSLQGGADHGRVLVSTGAIGGLDVLRAANDLGNLRSVSLESTKRPDVLVQPWMDPDLVTQLQDGLTTVVAFSGTAREAARRFPSSANVAATLGLATIGLDATRVVVVGDPQTSGPRHVIRAEGEAGRYEFSIMNSPSATNPRTSAITPHAVVRALQDLSGAFVVGF